MLDPNEKCAPKDECSLVCPIQVGHPDNFKVPSQIQ